MGMHTSKEYNVTFHAEYLQPGYPAVNVKVYRFGPDVETIMARHGCTAEAAEAALEYAWEDAVELFWHNDAPAILENVFGADSGLKIVSQGRSNGWLTVHGLPEIEEWDAALLEKWSDFERQIRENIVWLKGEYADYTVRYYLEEIHAPMQLELFEVYA